jgi:small-conductance mechanosensitive channel
MWTANVSRLGQALLFILAIASIDCNAGAGDASRSASTPVPGQAAGGVPAISVQDLLFQADIEQRRVELARQLAANNLATRHQARALDEIAAAVDARTSNIMGISLRGLPVMRLESLARHLDFDARRLAAWDQQARRAFTPYDELAVQLARSRAAWTATRAAASSGALPVVLSDRIDVILSGISDAEARLGDVLRDQLMLMQRSAQLRARIESERDRMSLVIAEVDERLLRIDSPPFWRAFGRGGESHQVWNALERGMLIERQFAIDYQAAGTGNQQALRLVQLLLLPLLVWLSMRYRAFAVATAEPARQALRRPISSWILLSMVAVLVLESDAPLLVHEFALLVAIVPVLRLLPKRPEGSSAVWPLAAVLLYAVDRLGVVASADSSLYRVLLLVLDGLALTLAWHAIRTWKPAPDRDPHGTRASRARRLVRPLAWVAAGLLAIAVAGNVVGNVTLAEMLTSGIIDSAYMAILLYACAIVFRDMARAALAGRTATGGSAGADHYADLRASLARLLLLGAACGWLLYSLDRFRLLRPARHALTTLLGLGIEVGEISVHIGEVLTFSVSAWLAYWLARAVRRVLREELPGHRHLARGVGSSIASLSYYAVLLAGFLIALSAAGVAIGQLAIVFGALGVGIGFGLQNIVNNFVSGLVLMFERPIQPGDTVEAAGVSGTVREISLRSTIIRTADGADTVIPNGMLLNGSLTNWTMYDRRRRFEIMVGVADDADPAQVLDILNRQVADTSGLATDPPPRVTLTEYGDGGLKFVVSVWTDDPGNWGIVRGDLLTRIHSALQARGIQVARRKLDVDLHGAVMQATVSPMS